MTNQISYKVCPQCKVSKQLDAFYRDTSTLLGIATYCKECSKEKRRQYPSKRSTSAKPHEYNKSAAAKYYKNNRSSAKTKYHSIKTNSPRRKIPFNLKKQEFCEWYDNQDKICHYCGRQLSQFKKGDDGLTIDRMNSLVGYQIDNIALSCWRCNIIKGYWFTYQEMEEIANKYLRKGG